MAVGDESQVHGGESGFDLFHRSENALADAWKSRAEIVPSHDRSLSIIVLLSRFKVESSCVNGFIGLALIVQVGLMNGLAWDFSGSFERFYLMDLIFVRRLDEEGQP